MDRPVISVLPGGGLCVRQNAFEGRGLSLPEALAALSKAMASTRSTEKGDETAATEDARRQADILANDRFIRGGQLQQSVLTAVALGLI